MSALRSALARLRALFREDPAIRLSEEMEAHRELLTAEYIRRGMTPGEAQYAAARELGNVTPIQQEYRRQSGIPFAENFWRDLQYAFRTLRRSPAFTSACIAALAVGLGSMITVLCVVSTFLWKPLPYPGPERLVAVKEVDPRGGQWTFSEPTLLDVEHRSRSLSALAAYRQDTVALTGADAPETIASAAVTPSLFSVLGVATLVGKPFQDAQPYAVISTRLWQRKWNRNPRAIGAVILLNGQSYTVSGVAHIPEDLLPVTDVLVPLAPKATESRSAHDIDVLGRLRTGISARQAQAELNAIAAAIGRENVQTNAGWGIRIMPLSGYLAGPGTRRTIWLVLAAVALLWLLACANIAGMQMARNLPRWHETGTRVALGATQARLLAHKT